MEEKNSESERAAEKKKTSDRSELLAIIAIVLCIVAVAIAGL